MALSFIDQPRDIIYEICQAQTVASLSLFIQISKRHLDICFPILQRKLAVYNAITAKVKKDQHALLIGPEAKYYVGIVDEGMETGPIHWYAFKRPAEWWPQWKRSGWPTILNTRREIGDSVQLEAYIEKLHSQGYNYHGYG